MNEMDWYSNSGAEDSIKILAVIQKLSATAGQEH